MVAPGNMFPPKKNQDYFYFSFESTEVYIEKKMLYSKSEVEFLIPSFQRFIIKKENNKIILL